MTAPYASMADVAARAGVSVATVSRALRNSDLVSADTAARVRAAADELAFTISRTASSLASGRLARVAVLVGGSLGSWFNGTILDAIYASLHAADHELVIFRIRSRAERDEFFTTLPARRSADAMIVASFALTPAERRRLQALGMPVVYLNQRVRGAASVSIDDAAGVRVGTRQLHNLGHRRIAFVRGENRTGFSYSAVQRIDGFRAEMAELGVPAADQLVYTANDLADGDGVTAQLLATRHPPTALMIDTDELAFSVLAALQRQGVSVPGDVSVLGFDDHALSARFGLSTIAQPADQLGVEAAAVALRLARGEPLARTVTVLPTRLCLRSTTGRLTTAAN